MQAIIRVQAIIGVQAIIRVQAEVGGHQITHTQSAPHQLAPLLTSRCWGCVCVDVGVWEEEMTTEGTVSRRSDKIPHTA